MSSTHFVLYFSSFGEESSLPCETSRKRITEDREVYLHRFQWRDSEEEELGEYAITRLNIGDKPAGCIAQIAMRKMANLPQFSHLREQCRVVQDDSYVNDILTSHNNLDQLKNIMANVEQILKAGGFELKPWVFSGQNRRKESAGTVMLPNQLKDEENIALGLGYTLEDNKLHVMVRKISFLHHNFRLYYV